MARKRRTQRKSRGTNVSIQKRPENYLTFGLSGTAFGVSTGGADPTWAANDLILNGGIQIAAGTGTNQRLGRKILFTRLTARLFFENNVKAQRVRVIVGSSRTSDAVARKTTINTITAFVEGNDVMEAVQSGATLGPIDNPINPSTDYVILHDRIYQGGLPSGTAWGGNATTSVLSTCELDIPLMLQRTYDTAGNPDLGDWFIYISTDTASLNQFMDGYIRLEFINQWTWEGVGKSIRGFVTNAGDTVDHVVNSKLVQYATKAAPYVFSAMA